MRGFPLGTADQIGILMITLCSCVLCIAAFMTFYQLLMSPVKRTIRLVSTRAEPSFMVRGGRGMGFIT